MHGPSKRNVTMLSSHPATNCPAGYAAVACISFQARRTPRRHAHVNEAQGVEHGAWSVGGTCVPPDSQERIFGFVLDVTPDKIQSNWLLGTCVYAGSDAKQMTCLTRTASASRKWQQECSATGIVTLKLISASWSCSEA